jgi:hypothetical protein
MTDIKWRMPQPVWENANGYPSPRRIHRRYVREKATIDHLVKECYEPKVPERHVHSSRTKSGQSVEEQVRKEWSPSKGGLPIF